MADVKTVCRMTDQLGRHYEGAINVRDGAPWLASVLLAAPVMPTSLVGMRLALALADGGCGVAVCVEARHQRRGQAGTLVAFLRGVGPLATSTPTASPPAGPVQPR